jgi:hypothetical protein
MAEVVTAFVANTNILELLGLKSDVEDVFINDATVTARIRDKNGDDVSGQSWPVAMAYVAASDGNYRGTLSDEIALVNKQKYKAIIDADAGPDRIGHWEFPFTAITRTGLEEEDE